MNSPNDNIKIAVIGGDLRQVFAAEAMSEKGYEVALFGFDDYKGDIGLCTKCLSLEDSLSKADVVVLGNPVTTDDEYLYTPLSNVQISIDRVFSLINEKCTVLGGRLGKISDKHSRLLDYFDREELIIANACITAESAVGIAMNEMKESIQDVSVLVMGYGRIGKALCHKLKGLGAEVYASARKERDFAWIRAFGYSPVDTSKVCDVVSSCKLVFNTIPKLVLGDDVLCCLQKDTLIIDLASKPGGVDFEAAKKCGLRVIWALGLPGKKQPVSAGRAEASVILDMLDEVGVI